MDDGSTDGCPKICDEYAKKDNRVRVIHQKNSGQADARNAALNIAKGEYFAFVDSDDFVSEDFIEYLFQLLYKSKSLIAICGTRHVTEGEMEIGEKEKDEPERLLTAEQAMEIILYQREFDASVCDKLFHRSLFEKIRFPSGEIYEDFSVIFRLIQESGKVVYGPGEKYCYRIHAESTMTGGFSKRKLVLLTASQQMVHFVTGCYPSLKKAAVRRDVYSHFHILHQMIFSSPRDRAKEKEIVRHIKQYAGVVLANPKALKKDKIHIRCLSLGLPVYRLAWIVFDRFFKDRAMRKGNP